MASLKEIRKRIQSVNSTQQITKAMKVVSAAKLKKATELVHNIKAYAEKLSLIVGNISSNISETSSPFLELRETKNVLIIPVTSNRGLAGAFNSNVIKACNEKIKDYQTQSSNVSLYCIGKKGLDFFKKKKIDIVGSEQEIFRDIAFEKVAEIGDFIMAGYADKKFDKVEIIYNSFKNPVVQIICSEQVLPFKKEETDKENKPSSDYIFEPQSQIIFDKVIPTCVNTAIYKAVVDSNASEHGARMTAMENATENAEELISNLKLSYNQARQASVTKELLEIVSGADALAEE